MVNVPDVSSQTVAHTPCSECFSEGKAFSRDELLKVTYKLLQKDYTIKGHLSEHIGRRGPVDN